MVGMTAGILLGVLLGGAFAAFVVVIWSCARARGERAGAIAVVLALLALAYFWLPFDWIPTPSRLASDFGVGTGAPERPVLVAVMILVAALCIVAASRFGLIARLSRWLSRSARGS